MRPHLFDCFPEELEARLAAAGTPITASEARRILCHVLADGHDDLAPRRPLRKAAIACIDATFERGGLEIVERVEDPEDRCVRYLFRSPDGALSEAVRIPLEKEGCFSVCLSSQAGCAMGCAFCATGRLGLKRNLATWEIFSAFRQIRAECPGRLTGAVFMGQGEPFHNYDAVLRAARLLSHPCGGRVDARRITISTVGLLPQIQRYVEEDPPFRLIVSLTSALPERRKSLLPVATKWSVEEVADALAAYTEKRREKATFAWVLLGGVNHDDAEVAALAALAKRVPFRLNLIDVNDLRPNGYRRATDDERNAFIDAVLAQKIPVIRRYSVGRSRHSACGMLASRRSEEAAVTA